MTDYLLLFRNASAPAGYLTSSQDMAEDMSLWQAWIGQIAQNGNLIHTAPVRYEASIVNGESTLKGHPHKEPNSIVVSGFLLCRAAQLEEVERWSKSCPILKYPHSSVEIRPLVPFPAN